MKHDRENIEEDKNNTTTIWECKCTNCGFTWTDNEDNTSCPECGSDEGICITNEIPSNPIMPND